jgi:hypothetical protein
MIPQSLVILGYAILMPLAPKISSNIGVCYFAVVVLNIGMYPINPGASCEFPTSVMQQKFIIHTDL